MCVCFEIAALFTACGEGKWVAISKLTYIWTLDNLASFDLNNLKQFVYRRTLLWSNYSIRKSSVSIHNFMSIQRIYEIPEHKSGIYESPVLQYTKFQY